MNEQMVCPLYIIWGNKFEQLLMNNTHKYMLCECVHIYVV